MSTVRDILIAIEDLETLVRERVQDPQGLETITKLLKDLRDGVEGLEETIIDLEAIVETCCDMCEEEPHQ